MISCLLEFQKDAMMMYGAILVDATHGTTQYDFLLITVLVVNDHGEGFPVSNHPVFSRYLQQSRQSQHCLFYVRLC